MVFHVATAVTQFWNVLVKFIENIIVRFTHNICQNIQTPTVRHANHHFFHSVIHAFVDNGIQTGNR